MRWTNRSTPAAPTFVDRMRLRRAALRYAEHGWAVTPGACLTDDRRRRAVLLATGGAFDVLEVPAALGLPVLGTARLHAGVLGPNRTGGRGPVAVTGGGRWMFFVRPGERLRTELANCLDVVLHGPGSWIPAAPTRMPEGPIRWAVPPEQTRWQLPAAAVVQGMLVDALCALGRPSRTMAVPRQVSTGRRAA
jgi:hypothetical protein